MYKNDNIFQVSMNQSTINSGPRVILEEYEMTEPPNALNDSEGV
jgi:hypothetical protein